MERGRATFPPRRPIHDRGAVLASLSMRVTLQLTPAAAKRVRTARSRSASRPVLPWLTHPLQPVHPTTKDPTLATFFIVDVEDASEASTLIERLLKDPSVEGAYIKPDDEPA